METSTKIAVGGSLGSISILTMMLLMSDPSMIAYVCGDTQLVNITDQNLTGIQCSEQSVWVDLSTYCSMNDCFPERSVQWECHVDGCIPINVSG